MGTHPIFESDFDCLTEAVMSRGPPNIDGMVSLKVDNLSYRTSTDVLRRKFERYGEIGDAYIPRDRSTGESRGFGFVRFHDKRDASDAIKGMDGYEMDGRELRVDYARHERPASFGGGRGGREGGRDRGGRDRSRERRRSRNNDLRRSRSRSRSNRRSRSRDRSRERRSRSDRRSDRDRSNSRGRDDKSASKSRSRSRSRSASR